MMRIQSHYRFVCHLAGGIFMYTHQHICDWKICASCRLLEEVWHKGNNSLEFWRYTVEPWDFLRQNWARHLYIIDFELWANMSSHTRDFCHSAKREKILFALKGVCSTIKNIHFRYSSNVTHLTFHFLYFKTLIQFKNQTPPLTDCELCIWSWDENCTTAAQLWAIGTSWLSGIVLFQNN